MSIQNTVKYTIFCNGNINVLTFCMECKSFCDTFIADYIWQKETFVLQPVEHHSGLPCLCGSTDFGENINDEWFIVFLLFELTKQFNDIVAQISDNDGEFLLIQAADVLPCWLKPETSQNRVFIHGGILHIIPLPSNPAELTVYPTSTPNIVDAYKLLIGGNNTFASKGIQEVILERIKGYPERFHKEFHHAHCFIPEEIVHLLQTNPHLVANAVQAFYERDPIDINICHQMKNFEADKRMITSVKFTRHLYGQLTQAQLLPHRNSKWRLPNQRDKLYKAAYLGYKLTCGFEIIFARSTSADTENRDNVNPSGRLWEQYVSNLKKRDYFQGELEGSKHYMELLEQAKDHFKNTFCSSSTSRVDEIGKEIVGLVNDAKMKTGDIKKSCEHLKDEDSEDWMTITPEELDAMMLNMWGTDYTDKDKDQGNVENLSKLATSVKSFVDNVSSYEGAEMPIDNEQDGDADIMSDPNTFMNCVKDLLDPPKYPSGRGTNDRCESDDGFADGDSDGEIEDDFISCFKDGEVDREMALMMERMDMELKESSVSQSFKATKNQQNTCDDEDAPFDVDINLIENFVESFSNQDGLAGPVSSILHSMGMNMPPDDGT